MIEKAEYRGVECILCGWSGRLAKQFPLKLSECQHCHRGYGLRRYYPEDLPTDKHYKPERALYQVVEASNDR